MNFIKDLPTLIPYLKEWWEEYLWQHSSERVDLAVKRLATYNKFMNGEPGFTRNPYTNPEDYNFIE